MINAGVLFEAYFRCTQEPSPARWEAYVQSLERANETFSQAEREFNLGNRDVFMNAQSPHKWWSTLKSLL